MDFLGSDGWSTAPRGLSELVGADDVSVRDDIRYRDVVTLQKSMGTLANCVLFQRIQQAQCSAGRTIIRGLR